MVVRRWEWLLLTDHGVREGVEELLIHQNNDYSAVTVLLTFGRAVSGSSMTDEFRNFWMRQSLP
jgi:hypothetical protein